MMYEQDANQKAHPLTMAGNRHYAKARDTSNDHDTRAIDATLALAFEQRTANLLQAFLQLQNAENGSNTYLGDIVTQDDPYGGKKLAETIAKRLGL